MGRLLAHPGLSDVAESPGPALPPASARVILDSDCALTRGIGDPRTTPQRGELDFDNPEIARQLNRPAECSAGLGQHRFCKTLCRYMG